VDAISGASKAKGGSIEDPKKDPQKLPKGYKPKRNDNPLYSAIYYSENLDNPEAYQFDEIFSSPGQVAGVYDNIRMHGGKGWEQKQAKFLENVDRYSSYVYGMRQADMNDAGTNTSNPGIVGLKDFPTPGERLNRNDPVAQDWLKKAGLLNPEVSKEETPVGKGSGKFHLYNVNPSGAQKTPVTREEYIEELTKINRNENNYSWGGEIFNQIGGSSFSGESGVDGEIVEEEIEGNTTEGAKEGADWTEALSGEMGDAGSDMIYGLIESSLSSGTGKLEEDIEEGRVNPLEALEKLDTRAALAGWAESGLSGASEGYSSEGGMGALIGGIAGTVTGGLEMAFSAKEKDLARKKAVKDWSVGWAQNTAKNYAKEEYKSGGKIKGKGTGKSDDVPMKAPEGAFIVPTENAAKAMEYGKDYLGWKEGEVAQRNYGNIDINTSNGEVYLTQEEYDTLSYYGINVEALAPDAEKNQTGFCRGGKTKKGYSNGGITIADLEKQNQEFLERDINDPLNSFIANAMADIDKEIQAETFDPAQPVDLPKKKRTLDDYLKNVGVLAGAAQVAGGAAGLISTGKRPDVNVSTMLKSLSRRAREDAAYGLPPAAKNALKKDQERTYQRAVDQIASEGGSAQDMQNRIMSALSTRLAAGEKTELIDYEAQEKKKERSIAIDMQIAGQQFDISKIGLESWERDQDVWANLISAGIENTIGASQYNRELKWMEENADRGTTFTIQ